MAIGGEGFGRRGEAGFTLIETLVALGLLSLVAAALAAAIGSTIRITERAELHAEATQGMRLVDGVIRRSFAAMVPLVTVEGRERDHHFLGEPDRVRFVAEYPARFRPGGLYEVVLEEGRGDEGTGVILRRRLVHPDIDGKPRRLRRASEDTMDERLLVTGGRVALAYYGLGSTPMNAADWHTRWEGTDGLPELVVMRIETEDGPWPPIVVHPRTTRTRVQHLRQGDDGSDAEAGAAERAALGAADDDPEDAESN